MLGLEAPQALADADLFLAGVFSLGHQPGYFNILPLYIVPITWAPVWLWLAHADRRLMLALSALMYAASRRCGGWNLPSWLVEGAWFFDPFAWQLLMAIGIAAGPSRLGAAIARAVNVTAVFDGSDCAHFCRGLRNAHQGGTARGGWTRRPNRLWTNR